MGTSVRDDTKMHGILCSSKIYKVINTYLEESYYYLDEILKKKKTINHIDAHLMHFHEAQILTYSKA